MVIQGNHTKQQQRHYNKTNNISYAVYQCIMPSTRNNDDDDDEHDDNDDDYHYHYYH